MSWLKYKPMTKKDIGSTFWLCLLAGGIIRGIIGGALEIGAIGCGIYWLVLTFKKKKV